MTDGIYEPHDFLFIDHKLIVAFELIKVQLKPFTNGAWILISREIYSICSTYENSRNKNQTKSLLPYQPIKF